ncbi:hypothetical protein CDAR_197821 [Caerostris darwini]|uniref:Uncharacterized protein n=1 Tax=Caerostris darwini TaxID=1538125 RepID=A0AAV4SF35_9ARAC|nr:hypothetical protein CDAR_197821 [Caerostris darwini]
MLECLVYQRYLFVSVQVRISGDTAVDREQYHMMQDPAKSTESRIIVYEVLQQYLNIYNTCEAKSLKTNLTS